MIGNDGVNSWDRLGLERLAPNCCDREKRDFGAAGRWLTNTRQQVLTAKGSVDSSRNRLSAAQSNLYDANQRHQIALEETGWKRMMMNEACPRHAQWSPDCQRAIEDLTAATRDLATARSEVNEAKTGVSRAESAVQTALWDLTDAEIANRAAMRRYGSTLESLNACMYANIRVPNGCPCKKY